MTPDPRILVYVQAVPNAILSDGKFSDLAKGTFSIGHSSKTALDSVRRIFPNAKIKAAGYPPVLSEAMARGADLAISLPLCDDPLEQARSFPAEPYNYIIIGENFEGPFSGSVLCGALASLRKMDLTFLSADADSFQRGGVVLVADNLMAPTSIDIRRINFATNQVFAPAEVRGKSLIEKPKSIARPEKFESSSPSEIAAYFSRRLRRFAVGAT
jgi:hypothetical protein